jgi:hypothetical protein
MYRHVLARLVPEVVSGVCAMLGAMLGHNAQTTICYDRHESAVPSLEFGRKQFALCQRPT